MKNIRYQPATPEQKEFILAHFGSKINSEFQISASSDLSAGQSILKIKIYAFRKSGSDVHILTHAEPEVTEVFSTSDASRTPHALSNASVSVLSAGQWYKIGVPASGVYKLTRTFFSKIGIDPATINPKNIRIFGTDAGLLPEKNIISRPDDLSELAIHVEGEADNSFDAQDYVLFYARGVTEWKLTSSGTFTYQSNLYSDTNYYFLTFNQGQGLRINTVDNSSLTENITSSSYDYYNFHELDAVNFLKSGREFFGEYFDFNTQYGFSFDEGNFVVGDSLKVFCQVAGRHSANNIYSVSSGTLSGNITCAGIPISVYSPYASPSSVWLKGLNNNYNFISVTVSKQTPNAVGWLDKIIVQARRNLIYNNKPFLFRDSRITSPGNICGFSVQSSMSTPTVWDVSNPLVPVNLLLQQNGTTYTFKNDAQILREYVVFNPMHVPEPVPYRQVPNQNLHAIQNVDYLIITHPKFLSEAQDVANLHIQQDNLNTLVVTTEQIFHEFSSGRPEATAIRDFIRMVYLRGLTLPNKLKYVLLFGRGSVFNKNGKTGNTNYIPTYQSVESLNPLTSVTTDDFFGLMDDAEGELAESQGSIDVGIGRIICTTKEEAMSVVRKIKNYYKKDGRMEYEKEPRGCNDNDKSVMGEWRNHMIFAADDGDGALHMNDADDINSMFLTYPQYIIHKIYIDAYKGISTPGGRRYPDMQREMNDRIDKGCLLFNYTGHGGEVGLAAERIVDIPTINTWKNFHALPLFITATCEFSRYDDPDRFSAGELCLLNPNGGAIALMTTCRLAFSSTNKMLNSKILQKMFDFSAGRPKLGDIIRLAKAELTQSSYYANFHLLGDPAITLAYPKEKIIIDSLQLKPKSANDTLFGMAKVRLCGKIVNTSNQTLTNFNGYASVHLYDKKNKIVCLLNDPNSSVIPFQSVPFTFYSRTSHLVETRIKVSNGRFVSTFIVPKNLLPGFDRCNINCYATDGNVDANGGDTSLYIGGISNNPVADNQGPELKLYLNNEKFVNGGITNQTPVLLADITDSSGINISGIGFGNDIKISLNQHDQRIINNYYVPEVGSYQKGKIRYPFEKLNEGNYSLELKVWDVVNNSSTARLDFVVTKDEKLALERVLNYPNPFTTQTQFFFEHNRPCDELKVSIEIFTVSGKSVKKIEKTFFCEGYHVRNIAWDGRDDFGSRMGRGVYIYRVVIRDSKNEKAEKMEKLVILN